MIIVFGGAFNPPTNAHYEIIKTLKDTFPLATIICLPVGNHYPKPELISFKHRFEMLKLMCQDFQDVFVSDFENQETYQGTFKSLEHFEQTYQKTTYFVVGSDHLASLHTWKNYQKLLEKYTCIIINRDGYLSLEGAEKLYQNIPHHFIFLEFKHLIASHKIRNHLDAQKHYIHQSVYEYILKHKLYQKESSYV